MTELMDTMILIIEKLQCNKAEINETIIYVTISFQTKPMCLRITADLITLYRAKKNT